MKKWDYEITIAGLKRTITAISDRAKQRTPEPREFANNDDTIMFVKAGAAEGFLFANRGFIDREYRNVRYHYFVDVNGQLVPTGQDNGPPDAMFEVGDVYPGGPRDGKHLDITAVVTGEMARANRCGVMVIGKVRDVSKAN
jgi:hypothetical protein